jgi:hypothetical protein
VANIYVRSTDGSDADNGSTWALANATLAGAIADAAAGDTIYVSDVHAESNGSAVVLTFPGTAASPNKVLCVDDAAQPPTALATTGVLDIPGTVNLTINGCAYVYGMTFSCGTGSSSGNVFGIAAADGSVQTYENCQFRFNTTGPNAEPRIGPTSTNAEARVHFENVTVYLGGTAQVIRLASSNFSWHGGGIDNTSAALADLFQIAGNGSCVFEISGLDLSSLPTTVNLFNVSIGMPNGTIRRCKLPASWTGTLVDAMHPGGRIEMHDCDSGDTNYRLWIEDFFGSIRDETTVVRTGGASDGTTALAWKMVSGANAGYPHQGLVSPEIAVWNDTTGAAKTVAVEVVTDNVTLTDGECWLEVLYLGTSGVPLGSWIYDAKADILASAANQTSSSETWTTTGLTTPVKQKLSVTFTPQEKGYFLARVVLAKPSTTVYVCPKLTVS